MQGTTTITFAETDERTDYEVSSWEAARMVGRYLWVIVCNTWRATDRFVHNWPWAVIVATIAFASVLSVYEIGAARSERDKAVGKQYQLQRQVEQYQIAREASK